MLLEEIEPSARHEYSHVMIVEEEQASETSRLFSENKELKRWERSFFADGKEREERQYIEGRLEALRIFAEDGNILEEREYASENAEQRETKRTRYQYRAGVLSSVEVFDGSGASLYRERYAYTKKGFLREIARSYPDGSLSVSAFIFGCGEGLVETRSRQDSRVQIYRYDTSGRINSLEVWDGNVPISSKSWSYHSDSKTPHRVEEYNRKANLLTVQQFDESGRLLSENRDGSLKEEVLYTYDGEGRIARKVITGPSGRLEWTYEHDEEGEIWKERLYRLGRLEKVKVYTEEESWIEEIYREGQVVLRVYYTNGQKSLEEFLQNGKVVSERSFKEE